MSHAELLNRIKTDAPGAFDDFVREFGGRVFGFGVRMCGEREDARDVFQDTMLQAYRSLKNLDHPEALRSWLFRVVSNACLMKRRKKKDQPDRELSLDELAPGEGYTGETMIPDPSTGPDEELERKEIRDRVRRAISEIPPHYRIVLLLRDIEQFSTREVSEMLDLPAGTVKMRLHRARLMVRARLEAEASEGGPS